MDFLEVMHVYPADYLRDRVLNFQKENLTSAGEMYSIDDLMMAILRASIPVGNA